MRGEVSLNVLSSLQLNRTGRYIRDAERSRPGPWAARSHRHSHYSEAVDETTQHAYYVDGVFLRNLVRRQHTHRDLDDLRLESRKLCIGRVGLSPSQRPCQLRRKRQAAAVTGSEACCQSRASQ